MRYYGQRGEERGEDPPFEPKPMSDAYRDFVYPPCPRCGWRGERGAIEKAPICWDELLKPQTHTV